MSILYIENYKLLLNLSEKKLKNSYTNLFLILEVYTTQNGILSIHWTLINDFK